MPYKDTNPSNKTLNKMEKQEYGKEIRKQTIEEFADKMLFSDLYSDLYRDLIGSKGKVGIYNMSTCELIDVIEDLINNKVEGIKKQMLKSDDFKSFDSNESQVLEKK